jgi:thiol:disulfide interchange protein DsbD
MPPPATDLPGGVLPHRAGSPRRDPVLLLAIAALLLLLRVVLGFHEAQQPPAPPASALSGADTVQWRTLEAGLAEAGATNRPILYDFTAEWCPPCQLMQRQLFADPQAAAEIEIRFVPVRVLDRQREEGRNAGWVDSLQARYRVNSFPTLIVAGVDGRESTRVEGFVGRDATLGLLRGVGVGLRLGGSEPAPTDRR